VNRFPPSLVLVAVTALFLAYGRYPWSWVAGPVAALFVWSLERNARERSAPASASVRRRPAAVD